MSTRNVPRGPWTIPVMAALICIGGDCGKKEDPAPPSNGGGTPAPESCTGNALEFGEVPSLQMCLDGQLVTLEVDDSEVFNSGFQTGFPGGMRYTSRFYTMAINDFRFGIELGLFADNSGSPTAEQFVGYLEPGAWESGDPSIEQGKASFFWRVTGGASPWSTYCDPGTQTDLTFEITDSEAYTMDGEQHVRIRATFSGTVYNCGGTGSKQVTDGTVVTVFRQGD